MASFGVGVQNRFELLQQPKKDDNTKEDTKRSEPKAEKQVKNNSASGDAPVKKGGKEKRGKGADTTDARGKRFFDRHSGTGRPIKGENVKEGHGKFGWGNAIEDYKQGVEETAAPAESEAKAEAEAEPAVLTPEDAENAKLKTLEQFYAEQKAKAVEGDQKEVRAPITQGFKDAIPISREDEDEENDKKANKGGSGNKGGKKNKKNIITMDEFNQLVKPKPEPKPFKPKPQPAQQQAAPAAAGAETGAPAAEAGAAAPAAAQGTEAAAGQAGSPRGRGGRGGQRGAGGGRGRGGRGGNSEGFRGGRGGGEGGRGGRGRGGPRGGGGRGGRGGRGGSHVDIESKQSFPSLGGAAGKKQ